jgi:hypothetical protein
VSRRLNNLFAFSAIGTTGMNRTQNKGFKLSSSGVLRLLDLENRVL